MYFDEEVVVAEGSDAGSEEVAVEAQAEESAE